MCSCTPLSWFVTRSRIVKPSVQSTLPFFLMPSLLRLGRGKLASGQWPVWIPKFTQPRHVRVGVEIHYLTLASGFKSFNPILFMHMHRTSCFFNVKPGYHVYIYMYGNFSAPRLLLFLWQS